MPANSIRAWPLIRSRESRDEVVDKYGAIEGGKQHLAKLEAYLRENLS